MDYAVFRYARLEPKTSFYYSNGKGIFTRVVFGAYLYR